MRDNRKDETRTEDGGVDVGVRARGPERDERADHRDEQGAEPARVRPRGAS